MIILAFAIALIATLHTRHVRRKNRELYGHCVDLAIANAALMEEREEWIVERDAVIEGMESFEMEVAEWIN